MRIGDPSRESDHVLSGKVVVDGGDVHIDASDPEHVVRIKHTQSDGIDVLHAFDKTTGAVTARIDSQGAGYFNPLRFLLTWVSSSL